MSLGPRKSAGIDAHTFLAGVLAGVFATFAGVALGFLALLGGDAGADFGSGLYAEKEEVRKQANLSSCCAKRHTI